MAELVVVVVVVFVMGLSVGEVCSVKIMLYY